MLFRAVSAFGDYVHVRGDGFEVNGAPYRFVGANLWYAMNLEGERLARELDRLKSIGVTNVRIMAASEGPDDEPWRMLPSLQPSPGSYNQSMLANLEVLFRELRARGIYAVVCLNNFWPWSGGMSQYLRWSGADPIPYPPPAPGGSWSDYQTYTAKFYSNASARELFAKHVRFIVSRFANEPAIMAWELANEPRGDSNTKAYGEWIASTAGLIKSLDPHHLVTTGSEGETPWPKSNGLDFKADHAHVGIDYATIHIWAENWYWYDPKLSGTTFRFALNEMRDYLWRHSEMAKALKKPLVIEEFGLARDDGSYVPSASTQYRDRYYEEVFEGARLHAAGVNFWAWAGEGKPREPGGHWKKNDPFTGDPPHEPQGWYGVYSEDKSTLEIISRAALKAKEALGIKTPGAL